MSIDSVAEVARLVRERLSAVVQGQDAAVSEIVVALLAGGHVLLEGPPGLGKTLLVRTLARLIRAEDRRIQFTPDLMPADVTGTSIFRPDAGAFEFVPGPIFTQILLADEINRTPPKTQAALLEAMQEGQVTVDGTSHPLPRPFFVVATQNPIEYEGTYPLPEAQLDRFFMKVLMTYPSFEQETGILDAHGSSLALVPAAAGESEPAIDAAQLGALRETVAEVVVDDSVRDYIVRLAHRTREHPRIHLGISSRAAVLHLFAAKTYAACDGRNYVRPDDVKATATALYRHRLLLMPEAEVEGIDADRVVAELLDAVEIPRSDEG